MTTLSVLLDFLVIIPLALFGLLLLIALGPLLIILSLCFPNDQKLYDSWEGG